MRWKKGVLGAEQSGEEGRLGGDAKGAENTAALSLTFKEEISDRQESWGVKASPFPPYL